VLVLYLSCVSLVNVTTVIPLETNYITAENMSKLSSNMFSDKL